MTEINIKDSKRVLCEGNKLPSLDIEGGCDGYIYKIPLDMLFYNDWNTRIVTAKSRYESEHNVKLSELFSQGKIEEYNSIIHDFIKKGNLAKFEGTKVDIRKKGQQEIGYVLSDGRIIDGNRRFTCLRELKKDTDDPRFDYFRAVIIDKDATDEQQIKRLELRTQLGKDEKVGYDPIDELLGLYLDVKEGKTTIHDYAVARNMKNDKQVEKMMDLAKLTIEFLDSINASGKYYIAQEFKLYGLLVDVYNRTKKIRDSKEWWRNAKTALFDRLLVKGDGDKVREIRPFIDNIVLKKDVFDNFFEEYEPYSDELHKKLDNASEVNTDFIRKDIRKKSELNRNMDLLVENYSHEVSIQNERNEPIKILEKTNKVFESIRAEYDRLPRLKGSLKENFLNELNKIQKKIDEINEIFNN